MTSVSWILVVVVNLLLQPSHAISFTPASQLGPSQSSWCMDNGCAEQFEGLGGCVNLAAPLQISALSTRFDLGATSLKGLCGAVGCCHCMKLLPNSTEAAKEAGESKPSSGPKKPTAKKTFCKEAWSKETQKSQVKETKAQAKETKVKETQAKKTKVKEAQVKETKAKETKATQRSSIKVKKPSKILSEGNFQCPVSSDDYCLKTN